MTFSQLFYEYCEFRPVLEGYFGNVIGYRLQVPNFTYFNYFI